MEYINVDYLIARIESIFLFPQKSADYNDGREDMKMMVLDLIDSLKQEQPNPDEIKREWYNKGYLKGRQDAHIPARELGLPKAFDFKPLDENARKEG